MAKVTDKRKPRLSLMTVAEMKAKTPDVTMLIDNIMVEGQPMVIGGPPKSLKTTLLLDLAVSLGTGTPFLDMFAVSKPQAVAVFSGESGKATVLETIARILKAKGKTSNDCKVHCGFRLPRLSSVSDRNELRGLIRDNEIGVAIIDPLYLCLLNGNQTLSAANLFDVGAVLAAASDACSRAGATMVLIHHTTKSSATKSGNATLNDLAFAGVGEFARQWMLVNRDQVRTRQWASRIDSVGRRERGSLVTVAG